MKSATEIRLRTPDHFRRWLLVAAVLLNALVLAAMGAALRHNYQNDEINAEVTTNNLLLVLREQLADNFQRIDLALQTVAADIQAEIEHDGMQDARLQRLLTNVLQQFLDVSAVGLVDSKGRVRMRTDAGTEPPLSQADLEQFGNLRDRHQAGLVVAAPVLTRMGREWVIPLTRPLHRSDGRLIGVVYAYVSLTRLRELFSTLDVGPNGTIVLRDSELRLVLRHPATAAFEPGRREVSAELQKRILSGQTSGHYKAVQPVDGIERLYVFSQIKAYPYYLIAGRATADYQAQWRRDAVLMALMTLLFVSGSALAVGLILRQRARQLIAFDDLRDSEAKLSAILENAGASIFVKDSNYRYLFANCAVLHFSGLPSLESLVQQSDELLFDAATVTALHENDRRVIENGETLQVIEQVVSLHDHQARQTLAVKMPMRRPDGSIYALCGIATDITELTRVQRREKMRTQVLEMLTRNEPLPLILESLVRGIEEDDDDLRCAVVLIAGSQKHLRTAVAPSLPEFFTRAIDGLEIGPGARSCGHAAFTGERMVAEDIQSHPFWAAMRGVAAQAGVHSCWAEPIRLSTGEVIGTFAIYRTRPKAVQAHEIEFIESVAHLAGLAIERQRKDAELKIAAQVFETSQEGIMVTDAANRIIAVNQAFTRITGYSREEAVGAAPSLLSSGQHDEAFFQAMWDAVVRIGNWQGEIWNRRKNGELYVEWLSIQCVHDPEGSGLRRIGLFTDITDRKQANELAWRNANFDLLTQLPNRRLFFDRLEQDIKQAQRDNARLALLFIDLDHFKQVNDMQGHALGDALLQETAQRLSASMAETDTLARLGSDQFAIILGEFLHPQDIEHTVSRLLDALRQPFELGAHPTQVTASIGIAVYPDDGPSAQNLLRNADHAMHVAKSQGRNSFSYFTAAMQQTAQQRQLLLADLNGALAKEQFELAYQPIVDLATGRIDKAEALLRWRHPQHGLVSPAAFIPLAEESGLIQSLGDWVFREAMRTTQDLIGRTGVPLKTSVNVSPAQFANDEFPAQWLAHLRGNGVAASALAVEITEGILIHHRPEVVRKLAALRQAGITVAIDDFGTGYSSLSYIKRFDIDVLKIDQSFVRDMASDFSSQALVEAIIVMAHKLGLKVVAEGIETAEQRDLLVALGCDYGQGYLLSRPMSAQDFEQLLLDQSCALAE